MRVAVGPAGSEVGPGDLEAVEEDLGSREEDGEEEPGALSELGELGEAGDCGALGGPGGEVEVDTVGREEVGCGEEGSDGPVEETRPGPT